MKDLEKAIKKEKEYLSYRMKGEEPFHFIDAVKECGFESIDEYFRAKSEDKFNNLNFTYIEKKPSECINYFFEMMERQETGVVFIDSDETFVFSGDSKPYNEDYCKENNIPVYPLYTGGGAIVSTVGDFSIGLCYPASIGVDNYFILNKLRQIFSKYMKNVEVKGNDILLNGEKICGSIMYHRYGMKCFAAHFSFVNHPELIEKICGVSGSIKVPTIIAGLNVSLFKNEVRLWLRV